jgi:YcaO-like protein with predicted kinase domain
VTTVHGQSPPPLTYAGRQHREDKEWVRGTHRAMDPALTLARIRPHLHRGGITRVADITGLDTMDVPVAVAIRPASGTLAVEGGKGITQAAAFTSAAMEAIERFVGEEDPVIDVVATPMEVAQSLPVAADAFPMMRYASVSTHRRYEWSRMRNLRDDREWLVPADLVSLPAYADGLLASHPWAASSNGLASGNHLLEAVCAGLYEVIERDAISCWQVAHGRGARRLVIDNDTIGGPVIRELLDHLDRRGADVQIVWTPTEIGVPTCAAYLLDRRPGAGIYKGYGCHLDPEIAMVRAVTEAVQGRTIFVAGARDDLLRASYAVLKRGNATPEEFRRDAVVISVDDLPDRATSSFHGDIAVMLDALAAAGFEHVLARELDASAFEVSVARVVVPGLEPYLFHWVGHGERARRFVAEDFYPAL